MIFPWCIISILLLPINSLNSLFPLNCLTQPSPRVNYQCLLNLKQQSIAGKSGTNKSETEVRIQPCPESLVSLSTYYLQRQFQIAPFLTLKTFCGLNSIIVVDLGFTLQRKIKPFMETHSKINPKPSYIKDRLSQSLLFSFCLLPCKPQRILHFLL